MMKDRMSALIKSVTLVLLLSLSLTSFSQEISKDAAVVKAGEELFNNNCKSCHRVKQKLVGPALAGVDGRVPSIAWIKSWVRNSAKVIASGDAYAVKLYGEYNKSQMTAFTGFTDDQIMSILAYVKAEEAKPDAAPQAATTGDATQGQPGGVPASYFDALLVGMLFILILLIVILGLIISALKKFLNQRDLSDDDKEVVNSPYTFSTVTRSSGFIFIVTFIVAGVVFKTVIDGLYSIGIQQNYQPKQPIAFSHRLHAGEYEINCKYCHTGAAKGKQANIPSPNICMNCHSQIKQESPEIQKIYAAIGYDVKQGKIDPTKQQKPIEWVRIHNLPDLAYFNHSQHVNVGGIECQTCHGPIQEMDVVKQYSLLTMGWCIDCHRKTDVNNAGNAYYDKLNELHQAAKGKNSKMKVEDIGGIECAKCHY